MEIFKPGEMNDYLNRFDNRAAYEAFGEVSSRKFDRYLETFENHWKLGIGPDGQPLRAAGQGLESDTGIRQNAKKLYSLNTSATTDGNRYREVMDELISVAITSNGLFELETNKKIDEDDLQRMSIRNANNQPNYEVAGITFDDEGLNIVLTLYGDANRNIPLKHYEIRGQGQNIVSSIGRLGLGNELMLQSADEMLARFMTEEKADSQQEGQRRSNVISTVDTGYMRLPVTKAITDQIINGRMIKEGELIYKSIFGGDPIYSSDPLDIVKAAFADSARVQALSNTNEYRSVANENYTTITVENSILENGNANASQAIRTVLSRIDQQASALGANIHITSLNRPGNTGSAHAFGDAVDLRVIRDGKVDMKTIDAVKTAMTELNSIPEVAGLYNVLLEFNDRSHPQIPELTRLLQGTPIKVIINPRATAPHLHIQFNRSQLAR